MFGHRTTWVLPSLNEMMFATPPAIDEAAAQSFVRSGSPILAEARLLRRGLIEDTGGEIAMIRSGRGNESRSCCWCRTRSLVHYSKAVHNAHENS